MFVGIAKLTVVIAQSHSLKEKRMVIRRIKDRVRDRVGVSLNEVGELESWQRAELGCAVASGDRGKAFEILDQVIRVAQAASDGQVVGIAKDAWRFDAPAIETPPVDDRTGSGDKAAGGDDWIPDEWRDDKSET
ncbi:MAG: DUF503 domain-containing protein [Kofleriaceae bacterium]